MGDVSAFCTQAIAKCGIFCHVARRLLQNVGISAIFCNETTTKKGSPYHFARKPLQNFGLFIVRIDTIAKHGMFSPLLELELF